MQEGESLELRCYAKMKWCQTLAHGFFRVIPIPTGMLVHGLGSLWPIALPLGLLVMVEKLGHIPAIRPIPSPIPIGMLVHGPGAWAHSMDVLVLTHSESMGCLQGMHEGQAGTKVFA